MVPDLKRSVISAKSQTPSTVCVVGEIAPLAVCKVAPGILVWRTDLISFVTESSEEL